MIQSWIAEKGEEETTFDLQSRMFINVLDNNWKKKEKQVAGNKKAEEGAQDKTRAWSSINTITSEVTIGTDAKESPKDDQEEILIEILLTNRSWHIYLWWPLLSSYLFKGLVKIVMQFIFVQFIMYLYPHIWTVLAVY